MKKRKLHLSASAIAAFKSCPISFRNKYVLGIRIEEDSEPQRIGTNWHRLLEVLTMKPGSVCPDCAPGDKNDPECPLCDGTGFLPDDMMTAITRVLNRAYEGSWKDPAAIATERAKLYYSLIGYQWYYTNEDGVFDEKVIRREQEFRMSVINPETGRSLPGVKLLGKIDKLIDVGRPAIKEHKSTSSSLDSDSDYWGHLNLDTQTKLYLYAARRMQKNGELELWGIKATDPLINTIKYDVWHKPTIKPKMLTQAESKKFAEIGEYFTQKFEVMVPSMQEPREWDAKDETSTTVDGVIAEVKPGAKEGTFQIRETPEMYGARLLADIGERPEFYFRCVELTRTDKEMESFEYELLNIYRTMQNMIKTGHWYGDEHHCEAKFKCDYIHACYNGIEISEDNVPEGMKCIFKKGTS